MQFKKINNARKYDQMTESREIKQIVETNLQGTNIFELFI